MALRHHALRLGPLDNATHVLVCGRTGECAVVDAGFEADAVVRWVREQPGPLTVRHLLATHAHYDHVCGMRAVQEALGGGFRLHPADRPLLERLDVQAATWGFPPAAAPAEVLDLADGERLALGEESIEVIHTPGHSPGGVCFRGGDDLWSGDTLFAGSVGRTDLPGGSVAELERSIRGRLFALGDAVRVHPGHGPSTTIGRERTGNPFVGEGRSFT
jgi:glyoxylase-like metal-dependent hydrolase (beta-lactamase superfamily II)